MGRHQVHKTGWLSVCCLMFVFSVRLVIESCVHVPAVALGKLDVGFTRVLFLCGVLSIAVQRMFFSLSRRWKWYEQSLCLLCTFFHYL